MKEKTKPNEYGPSGKQGIFSRLEGRPRSRDFTRSLRAETYDGLWYLARQWQFGELKGEDTGSAIVARINVKTSAFFGFAPKNGDTTLPFDNGVPLETQVEAEDIDFDLRTHMQITLAWRKLLEYAQSSALFSEFIRKYPYEHAAKALGSHALSVWKDVAGGIAHVIGINQEGMLWAWGSNTFYRLGDGTKTDRTSPALISVERDWEQAFAGFGSHSFAIKSDGRLFGWGLNNFGQLGNGEVGTSSLPVRIGSKKWRMVAPGIFHTAGIDEQRRLYTWGRNDYGRLGLETSATNAKEVHAVEVLPGTFWKYIAAGGDYSLAIDAEGRLFSWGDNSAGQLGLGLDLATTPYIDKPVQVGTSSDWVEVTAGLAHTLAIREDPITGERTLWAWGNNIRGQLGIGAVSPPVLSPVKIGTATDWQEVAAGRYHSLGLKTGGLLWAWGENKHGALGDNIPDTSRADPRQTKISEQWKTIRAGEYFSLGIATDNRLWGWGANINGQLGLGHTAHQVTEPASMQQPDDKERVAALRADQRSWKLLRFSKGKVLDGKRLLEDARKKSFYPAIGVPSSFYDPDGPVERLVNWFDRSYYQPEPAVDGQLSPSWEKSRLEYRFAVSVPDGNGQIKLTADEYYHGKLDWYNFEIDEHGQLDHSGPKFQGKTPDIREKNISVIPSEVTLAGFPNARWWAFENGSINPAAINGGTGDIARVLLFQFALLYSNDWFFVPLKVPANSLSTIQEFIVTDVFGRRTLVRAANYGRNADWDHWSMYNLTRQNEAASASFNNRLLIPPAIPVTMEGRPLEVVEFMRDEMANLVYGIEAVLPDVMGRGKDARTSFRSFRQALQELYMEQGNEQSYTLEEAEYYYQITVNDVPEYWIPFTPVKLMSNDPSHIRTMLQRGYFKRSIPGVPNRDPVRPKSRILAEEKDAYKIKEEEIPRAGAQISRSFQLARWYDGKSFLWLGRRKRIGRGEGQSGLKFDVLSSEIDQFQP